LLFSAVCSLRVQATMWIAAVTSVFSAGRGLALAVTMTGAAFAQIIVPPYAQWLIAEFGWRAAWVGLGLGWGIPALLLSVLFLFDAHDRNREQQRQVDPNTLAGLSVKEAARCKDLWLIAGSTILMMMLTVAVLVHQVPILTDVGLSREDAAWLASIGGIAGIAGKLATGWMMDRFSPHKIAGSTMAFAGLGFFFLLEPFRSVPVIIACMFVIGYSSGAKLQVTAFLTSRYAGTRNFGVIFGVMSSMITVGAGIGPTLAGAIYDGFGSYSPLLMAGVPGCALAGYCLFRLSPQPRFTASAVDHESDV